MGATVTCGKRVAAFRNKNGEVTYVLFESTYEKNCYPHTPHESALAVGSLKRVLKTIFACGSSCEGGCLQGPGGQIHPESYIAGWMKALANPVEMNGNQTVSFKIAEYRGLPIEHKATYLNALRKNGLVQAASDLDEGKTINVLLDSDVVTCLFSSMEFDLMAWRLDLHFPFGGGNSDLAYCPVSKSSPLSIPAVVKSAFNPDEFFTRVDDGLWKGAGWSYSVVANFTERLWENEVYYPGSYKKLIKQCREACLNAPSFSDSSVAKFFPATHETRKYAAEEMLHLASKLGLTLPCEITSEDVMAKLNGDRSLIHTLHYLAREGLVQIDTPNGPCDLAPTTSAEAQQKIVVPKLVGGLVVEYGGVNYKLVMPAGPRKGWNVERISDGASFRMKANQIASALHDMALEAVRAAKEVVTITQEVSTVGIFQQQAPLF